MRLKQRSVFRAGLCTWVMAILAAAASALAVARPQPPQAAPANQPSSVLDQVRRLPGGLVDIDSLDLPEAFLWHVIDWDLRGRFRSIYHRVAPDPEAKVEPTALSSSNFNNPDITIRTVSLPRELVDHWVNYPFATPGIRGFRATAFEGHNDPWPFDIAAAGGREAHVEAARYVAQHLARDGLVRTTAQVMRRVPLHWTNNGSLRIARLRAIGIPVDLLSHFTVENVPLTTALATWFDAGADEATIEPLVARATFSWMPSCPGFRVMAEDGSEAIGAIRFQLPHNAYVLGEGDGSVVDVFRQIAQRWPSQQLIVSVHRDGVDALLQTMRGRALANPQRITLVPHPANITQWAQDNAKSGVASPRVAGRPTRIVTLIPRYASRTELRTQFVPSDSFVFETLGRGVLNVVQSPLLFQGGNLLPVNDPRTGKRVLLIGEAEIYRNRALGLSVQQVLQAFAAEFGVDGCEVLPAVSFHLDLDLTVRRVGNELVACVNDDLAGSRMIVNEGVRALTRSGIIPAAQQEALLKDLSAPDAINAIATIWESISPLKDNAGVFGPRFTAAFAASPIESGAANARRFLAALDIVTAATIDPRQWPAAMQSKLLRPYMEAIRRHEQERMILAVRLHELGMRVHRIPGLCDHEVSMSYVNGLHLPSVYAMPTHGGLYAALDDAAQRALQQAFGQDVRIERFKAAVMQIHDGGLHCLVGMMPAIEQSSAGK